MPSSAPHEVPARALLRARDRIRGLRILEGQGPEGWLSPPGRPGDAASLAAIEPEVEFRGGLEAMRDALRWLRPGPERKPFEQILVGHLSYELGRSFERLPPSPAEDPLPEVCLAGYRAAYVTQGGRGRVVGSDPGAGRALRERIRLAAASGPGPPAPALRAPTPRRAEAEFRRGVAAIRRRIRAGDVYQVNLSRLLELGPVPASATAGLYARLTARTPAPFAAYLDAGDHTILSNSPERFLRVANGVVETCPVKGTRPRGRTPEEDRLLAKELTSSDKDRAEHVMIVDVERNDLGRVCRIGTVRVPRLAELRSYATVHHLVSSVQGMLRARVDPERLLAATFPGGSITGAPKIRAMELISELESEARGVYTGAIGWIDSRGEIDLSIAIRTAILTSEGLTLRVGGGIVADSDPAAELSETTDKARAFFELSSVDG